MRVDTFLPFEGEELRLALEEANKGNALPLRALCQKEVACFETSIRQHPDYKDGLILIERRAVEGYLYQKLRGHIDATPSGDALPKER
jgi:hypothetical protein